MTTSAQITSLINSTTALKTYFEGARASIVQASLDAVATIAANQQLILYVDPDDGSDENAGTSAAAPLRTVAAALTRQRRHSTTIVSLLAGREHLLTLDAPGAVGVPTGGALQFQPYGAGLPPVLRTVSYALEGAARLRLYFVVGLSGAVLFRDMEVNLAEMPDGAVGAGGASNLFRAGADFGCTLFQCGFEDCLVRTHPNGPALISGQHGGSFVLSTLRTQLVGGGRLLKWGSNLTLQSTAVGLTVQDDTMIAAQSGALAGRVLTDTPSLIT